MHRTGSSTAQDVTSGRVQRRRRWRILAVVLVVCASAALSAQAEAATYTAATGDNSTTACPNPSSGTCTLRQLILYENQNAPNPPDTIIVPAGSYPLSNEALTITHSLSIVGSGARSTTIDEISTTPDRVFDIQVPPNGGSAPTVSISGLTIEFGTANRANGFFGGNIRNAGNLTLTEDWITSGTTSFGSGGGVSNDAGTLLVQRSLISGNNGGNDSGGIQNFGSSAQAGNLTVIDSTIANNNSQQGGGIFSWCNSSPCTTGGQNNTTTVINSTIVHNDGGPRNAGGGGLLQGAGEGTMSVQNSIVAFNTVSTPAAGTPSNCGGSGISSGGYNIDSGADCGFAKTGDRANTDPGLTSTAAENWGGNTDTFGLDARSPAVDAIPPGTANCNGPDQRDVNRPVGQGCDIGAFEVFQPLEAQQANLQVLADSCGVFGQATINWGDGTPTSMSQPGTFVGSHTYAKAGTYNGTVTYTNDCGTHTNVPFDVKVQNGVFVTGSQVAATAGSPFAKPVATFTDGTPGRAPGNFSATINWGDGTSSAGAVTGGGGSFTVNGSHTYSTPATYTTTITVTDVGGASSSANGAATVSTNPATSPAKPVVSSTAAQFAANVNPEGSLTAIRWEYGLDPADRGPGFSGNVYDQSTPVQIVGSDYVSHFVAGSASNLQPNSTYHVRLVAVNGAGTTLGSDQVFVTPKAAPPPSPVLGKTLNFTPSGTVFVLIQGQFVKLTQSLQLPTGTVVDALQGAVSLVSAGGSSLAGDARVKKPKKPTRGTGTFGGAVFKVTQTRSGADKGLSTLSIVEGAFTGAPTYASCKAKPALDAHAALSRRVLQTLRARATGRFRTRGRYAAGTVRGTGWTTSDRCDGTLIAVQQHSVLVSDLVKHISILVRAGHHYLAKAPSPKRHK